MKAETYDRLLKALQKLEKRIVQEGVKRARGPLKARVRALHDAAETGGRLDEFAKVLAGRSAAQFLLRTVYVRVLEDLGLLDPPRIRGQRGYRTFRDVAPQLGVRSYFKWIFRDLAVDFPDLFGERDDELPLPSEALCQAVWELWHEEDGRGNLRYDWTGDGFESRFLGDLYQDLDADVRKRYALLQTPDFVEAYILDHTLTPALEAFDPETLRAKGETFRLIDPTCGSGHFLIGAFHRLADYWEARGLDPWTAAERALDSVWGCDINPHAVHIAEFRLLLEVMHRTGVKDLDRLAGLRLHLRVMDSLIPWEGVRGQQEIAGFDRLSQYATPEERAANAVFLGRDFHVVVGNPPYVTPKDPRKRDDYRVFWPASATGGYGLAAPFVERLFVLGCPGAYMGQITGNAFIKRSFGVSLIEKVLPNWDLTDIIDTSGAYIPGHGTPTVILFGRCRAPVAGTLRVVGGKRGESSAPAEPAEGKIWRAIVGAGWSPDDSSPFVTVSQAARSMYSVHPWNLNGGGAPELQLVLVSRGSSRLDALCEGIGRTVHTGQDPAFFGPSHWLRRAAVTKEHQVTVVRGTDVRDYSIASIEAGLFPYRADSEGQLRAAMEECALYLWGLRSHLRQRRDYGQFIEERGLAWFEWSMFFAERFKRPLSIVYAEVATHNHFVLDRGGKVFNRTAPAIKLRPDATLDDHLDLLGLLNSSTLDFWTKQVFFCKGGPGGQKQSSNPFENFYARDSTKLARAPITDRDRPERIALAAALDAKAQERAAQLPAAVLAGDDWTAADLPARLAAARERYHALTREMVALQEELDWLTYRSYGLLDGHTVRTPDEIEPLAPGHRPFEIVLARHNATCDPDERSAWFTRHGHDETTEIPAHYTPATRALIRERLDLIAAHKEIRLIEQPQFKRRWQLPDLDAETRKAARAWLLDRLEDLFAPARDGRPEGPLSAPVPYRLEEVVNAWRADDRVLAVAAVYQGTSEIDLSLVAEALLREEAIPDNIFRVYTDEGLRKLRQWQEVWRLQDREDAGEKVDIPKPPEFAKGDFRSDRYFQIRGKLNVPRERFILYADVFPHRYGWNGWRDRDRALAQVEAFTVVEGDPTDPLPRPATDDPRRCGATVGLWESLDDVRRWGDPADHAELLAFAQEACGQQSCPCDVAEAWRAWADGKLEIQRPRAADQPGATIEERDALIRLMQRLAPVSGQLALEGLGDPTLPLAESRARPVSLAALRKAWPGPADRLELVLDDLVASGDLTESGRGERRKYTFND